MVPTGDGRGKREGPLKSDVPGAKFPLYHSLVRCQGPESMKEAGDPPSYGSSWYTLLLRYNLHATKFTFLKIVCKDFYLFIFYKEGKGGRKRGRQTVMCGCLSHSTPLGTWPGTQACALTGNRTGDPLVHRLVLNPLSHTSQGGCDHFYCFVFPFNYF